ncbi:hypothetical protein OP10G_0470 [Fimbriimonas ginsengisoli Gsoil 348]|uniref:Uncharacterized protein n=1 Tax=Fimbriimonas ginsengisoli Gsoil 348 TaxID=661478 RepID=A0A068NJQ3_FIMGI|nr:hypothetical protein OP10G_0470 [Fimbriimonas ginsengisoli Gsoil 348]
MAELRIKGAWRNPSEQKESSYKLQARKKKKAAKGHVGRARSGSILFHIQFAPPDGAE